MSESRKSRRSSLCQFSCSYFEPHTCKVDLGSGGARVRCHGTGLHTRLKYIPRLITQLTGNKSICRMCHFTLDSLMFFWDAQTRSSGLVPACAPATSASSSRTRKESELFGSTIVGTTSAALNLYSI